MIGAYVHDEGDIAWLNFTRKAVMSKLAGDRLWF